MKDKKVAATFRLSETALRLLLALAERGGTTKTAILEALIRQEARRQKVEDRGESTR
jgi:predicted transcriptional regulator